MKFDKKILESFLWETHSIEKSLQLREQINKGTPQDKIDLCHILTLNNFFLMRRVRDPGFSQFVTEYHINTFIRNFSRQGCKS